VDYGKLPTPASPGRLSLTINLPIPLVPLQSIRTIRTSYGSEPVRMSVADMSDGAMVFIAAGMPDGHGKIWGWGSRSISVRSSSTLAIVMSSLSPPRARFGRLVEIADCTRQPTEAKRGGWCSRSMRTQVLPISNLPRPTQTSFTPLPISAGVTSGRCSEVDPSQASTSRLMGVKVGDR
jgi:hypothetical protein